MRRINLLPGEERAKALQERGLAYALLALIAVVVALTSLYLLQVTTANAKQEELAQTRSALQAEEARRSELQPYARLEGKRTSMTETARGIYDSRILWSSILQQVSLVIPTSVQLTALTGAVPATMLPGTSMPAAGAAAGADAGSVDITFTGMARTHRDVADFMTRLGLIPQFTAIRLTSSSSGGASGSGAATAGGGMAVSFTVTASLRPYLTAPPTTTMQQQAGGSQQGGEGQ